MCGLGKKEVGYVSGWHSPFAFCRQVYWIISKCKGTHARAGVTPGPRGGDDDIAQPALQMKTLLSTRLRGLES